VFLIVSFIELIYEPEMLAMLLPRLKVKHIEQLEYFYIVKETLRFISFGNAEKSEYECWKKQKFNANFLL
jgi:hypothetical protein